MMNENCKKADFWADMYQYAGSKLSDLGLFETEFGSEVLDYLDGKVGEHCDHECIDYAKCQKEISDKLASE